MPKSLVITANSFQYNRPHSDLIEKIYFAGAKSLQPKVATISAKNLHPTKLISKGIFGGISLESSSKYYSQY